MASRAIILVEAALGKSTEIIYSLRKLECVLSAERVTPPYDVIALIEVDASQDVNDEVPRQLGIVDGIIRTVVCCVQDLDLPRFAPLSQDDPRVLVGGHSQ